MLKYIYSDLSRAVRYLPYGLALGVPVAVFIVWLINRQRRKKQKEPLSWVPVVIFGIYLAVLLMITFLSRESGSSKGVIDMDLFSTWGINDRNNAFVVENVLLFIPYGFLCSWNFRWAKKLWKCTLFGAVTSFGIEFLQLVTRRGFFQIDDILTNVLGTVIGWLLFRGIVLLFGPRQKKAEHEIR